MFLNNNSNNDRMLFKKNVPTRIHHFEITFTTIFANLNFFPLKENSEKIIPKTIKNNNSEKVFPKTVTAPSPSLFVTSESRLSIMDVVT